MPVAANYLNRELSWLEFNQRVLDEACDPQNPLLERLKFVAITSSNLDEFFGVRVGGLQSLVASDVKKRDPSGMTPSEQLAAITTRALRMVQDQYKCLEHELRGSLSEAGIVRAMADSFDSRQIEALNYIIERELYPVITPQSLDEEEPFPLLPALTLHIAVRYCGGEEPEPRFAIIPLGRSVPRTITLQAERGYRYVLVEDVVVWAMDRFFPDVQVLECACFRVTRNADMSVREDLAGDLLHSMQDVLDARRESQCVRLELAADASAEMERFLTRSLEMAGDQVFRCPGPLDLTYLMSLAGISGYDELRFPPWPPQASPQVDSRESMFDNIAREDILLYHPYESFEPVVRFIEEAAVDADVLAIKQTLYRTSRESPVVAALVKAAERGKYVTAIVELKARFDEARNIEWAQNLEKAGVQVIYGVKGLKTHAKVCIVVRREPHGMQRYMHFGTGNYNESTARLYSDASLFTCNEELGAEASRFFNSASGYSRALKLHHLEMAPFGLRDRLLEMIDSEIERKRHGQHAEIRAKINTLVDPKVIDYLYAASQAGVRVRLNVRGVCSLRPGVPGLSENIEVVSIVDRFLEHARILHFHHGGDERVFISSADWMQRNLDRRVELLVPVLDAACRDRLIAILEAYFNDTVKSRWLQPDGSYHRKPAAEPSRSLRSQEVIYREVCRRVEQAERSRPQEFEPHRANVELRS